MALAPSHRIVASLALVGAVAGAFWYATEIAPARSLLRLDPNAIPEQAGPMHFATAHGEKVFHAACASCHGAQGAGDQSLGVPNLTDADWLYGTGTPAEIERTISYGIRSRHPKARNLTAMPAYARDVPLPGQDWPALTPGEIGDLVAYVVSLSGSSEDVAASARGAALFTDKAGCFDCHAPDARGDAGVGAPNLTDAIWLYGDGRAAIADSISYGRQGVCPAQAGHLRPAQIREAALYVYALSHRSPSRKVE